LQDSPKFTQIWIFGLKTNHLATLPKWGFFFHLLSFGFGAISVTVFKRVHFRVARSHILKPKNPIWVNLGWSCKGSCWHILWPFGLFYSNSVIFVGIWYILWTHIWYQFSYFGIFYPEESGNLCSFVERLLFKTLNSLHIGQ
jgi:hypothetical protein